MIYSAFKNHNYIIGPSLFSFEQPCTRRRHLCVIQEESEGDRFPSPPTAKGARPTELSCLRPSACQVRRTNLILMQLKTSHLQSSKHDLTHDAAYLWF